MGERAFYLFVTVYYLVMLQLIIVKAGHLSNFGKPFQPSGSVLLNLVAEPSSCNVVLDINIILAHDLLIIHFYCVLLNMGSVVHMSGFICVLK